jgi:hypothetical protein
MASDRQPAFVRAARHIPGLRRLPAVQLIAVAEIVLMTRDHVRLLTPSERKRVIHLVRSTHGRPRNLTQAEREELVRLLEKAQPRALAGKAADALSPLPLPDRMVFGRRGRPR